LRFQHDTAPYLLRHLISKEIYRLYIGLRKWKCGQGPKGRIAIERNIYCGVSVGVCCGYVNVLTSETRVLLPVLRCQCPHSMHFRRYQHVQRSLHRFWLRFELGVSNLLWNLYTKLFLKAESSSSEIASVF
jgi:hypothetical protein